MYVTVAGLLTLTGGVSVRRVYYCAYLLCGSVVEPCIGVGGSNLSRGSGEVLCDHVRTHARVCVCVSPNVFVFAGVLQ